MQITWLLPDITLPSYNLGFLVGATTRIWLGNWLGRRKSFSVGSFIMITGANLQAVSFGPPQFIVGRIVTAVGNSSNISAVPYSRVPAHEDLSLYRFQPGIERFLIPKTRDVSHGERSSEYWWSHNKSLARLRLLVY